MANLPTECKCIDTLVMYHEWIFSLDAKSEKELIVEEGLKRLELAKLKHKQRVSVCGFYLSFFS